MHTLGISFYYVCKAGNKHKIAVGAVIANLAPSQFQVFLVKLEIFWPLWAAVNSTENESICVEGQTTFQLTTAMSSWKTLGHFQ